MYATYRVVEGDNGSCVSLIDAIPDERLRNQPEVETSQIEAMKAAVEHFASITGLKIQEPFGWKRLVESTGGNCNVWFVASRASEVKSDLLGELRGPYQETLTIGFPTIRFGKIAEMIQQLEKLYHGWSNYETWVAALSLYDDFDFQRHWRRRAAAVWQETDISDTRAVITRSQGARAKLAYELRENFAQVQPPRPELCEVNWGELASSFLVGFEGYEE